MTTTAHRLLAQIEKFLAKTGMPATTFGVRAVNDGALVEDLRHGRRLRLDTADRITEFMASYRAQKRRRSGPLGDSAAA